MSFEVPAILAGSLAAAAIIEPPFFDARFVNAVAELVHFVLELIEPLQLLG